MKKAKWIWNNSSDVNQYVEFVGVFSIEEITKDYFLSLSVTGNYCLYLNEHFVGCARFDDYPEYKIYDRIDIREYLMEGKNTVKILAYAFNVDSCRSVPMQPAFIAEVTDEEDNVLFYTDRNTQCRFSPWYKSGDLPKFGNKKSFTVEMTMTENEKSFDFQDSRIVNVEYNLILRPCKRTQCCGDLPSVLLTQGVVRVDNIKNRAEKMHKAWLSHRHLSTLTNVYEKITFPGEAKELYCKGENLYFIFDLQAEQNGYLSFDFELKEDADVEIAFGEHLDDLRVRSEIGGRDYTFVIHAKKGKNRFTDYINRVGCRYLQVYVYAEYCKIRYFGMNYDEYPVTVYPYETDNALRKEIYKASVKTLKECMHEHYEDCPLREQALYAMDSRNQMLCGYYTFKEYKFARASIELLLKRIRKDGHTYITAPRLDPLSIPCFSMVAFLAVKEYGEYSGDLTLAENVSGQLKIIMDTFIASIDKSGLLPRFVDDGTLWNFYEWTEGMWSRWGDKTVEEDSVEYPAVLNAFFVIALDSYSDILLALKKDASLYKTLSKKIKQIMSKRFWQEEKNCFASYETDGELSHYHELTNAMFLYCGVGTEFQRKKVATLLMQENETLAPMTLSMLIYKYQALIDMDINNRQYVFRDIDKKWGYMLYHGATTFWETLKGADDFGGAASLCHGWSAIPAYFYMRYGEE